MTEQAKDPITLAPVQDVIQVRFSDTDAMGHISSGSYAAFAEVGRETFFKKIPGERADIPWFVLARLAMDYPSEARYGQAFTLSTSAIRIGEKSLTLEQVVYADGKVACKLEVVMVAFDRATRKSAAVPRHWRLG